MIRAVLNAFVRRTCERFKRIKISKEQEAVYQWLQRDLGLSVYAEAYMGALTLRNQNSAGHITLVAHVGRDIMNGLAGTVLGITRVRVQYQDHIDSLQSEWRDEWRYTEDLSPEILEAGHLIPVNICQKISTLIEEHERGRVRSADADGLFFSAFLDYPDKEKIPENFLAEWKAAKRWFLSHAHLRGKPFGPDAQVEMQRHFDCLDGYLYIAASSQYDRLVELNEILDATNN